MHFKRMMMSLTYNKLEALNRYIDEIECKFESDKKNIGKRYENELARLGEELDPRVQQEIGELYGEEYGMVEEIFSRQFRYSILVTVYSILEKTLTDLCYKLRHIKKLTLELDELNGRGIERAKLYLSKVCLIDFPENLNEWNEIKKLNKIRNCIVHAEGDIHDATNPEKLENIIKNTKGLDIERDRYIKIDSSYIKNIETTAKSFLNIVFQIAFRQ